MAKEVKAWAVYHGTRLMIGTVADAEDQARKLAVRLTRARTWHALQQLGYSAEHVTVTKGWPEKPTDHVYGATDAEN